jgi:hypothetical protein
MTAVRTSELHVLIQAVKPTMPKEEIRAYIKSLSAKERSALLRRLRRLYKS